MINDIASGSIDRSKVINMYKNIVEEKELIRKSLFKKNTEKRRKMMSIFEQLRGIFIKPRTVDETDDETDDQTDDETDEQPDTINIPDLESEKSAEQRKNQEGQELKILTPNQMLSRLTITLARSKVGNNSEMK